MRPIQPTVKKIKYSFILTVLIYALIFLLCILFSAYHLYILSEAYKNLVWIPILMIAPALIYVRYKKAFRRLIWIQFLIFISMIVLRIALDLWLPVKI